MFIPELFTLHVGSNAFYDPIHKIRNSTYIVGISISHLSPVFVPIRAELVLSAHVGHRYWDTHLQAALHCGKN